MQDLISNPERTMSSLELLSIINKEREEAGQVYARRNHFHERVADELEGEYYQKMVVQNLNGTETTFFKLTKDQCMLVAMRESKAVRRAVLDKLKELDKPQEPSWIANLSSQARIAIADLNQQVEQQQAQLEAQKPAVEFVERYTDSTGLVSLTQAAKDLQFKPRAFTRALEASGYLYRTGGALTPYQRYLDQGLFAMVSGEKGGHGYSQTKVTTKGKTVFAQRFASELID